MSNATTSVDVPGMVRAQGDFENAVTSCQSASSQMENAQATLAGVWTGDASSAFSQALSTFLEDLGTVTQQLSTMTSTLQANTGMYANTDNQTTDAVSTFSSGLQGF